MAVPDSGGPAPTPAANPINLEQDREAVVAAVREELPKVAGIDIDVMQAIANGPRAPRIDDFPDQSLSALFIALDPEYSEAASQQELDADFKYLSATMPRPSEIADAFRKGPVEGKISLVHAEDIKSVECSNVAGDEATGVVKLQVRDLLAAQVHFEAVRKDGAWKLQTLRLPGWEVETARATDGMWKATGECVRPTLAVRLPTVVFGGVSEPAARRLVVTIGSGTLDDEVPQDLIAFRGQRYPLSDQGKMSFQAAVRDYLDDNKLSVARAYVVVRADRRSSFSLLVKAMKTLLDLGFSQVGLEVQREEDVAGTARGSIPITAFRSRAASDSPELDLPPIRIAMLAAQDGKLLGIRFNDKALGGPEAGKLVQRELLAILGDQSDAPPLVLDLHVDGNLEYNDFVDAVAAWVGYAAGDGGEKWTPLPVTLCLESEMQKLGHPAEPANEILTTEVPLELIPTEPIGPELELSPSK